MKKRDKIVDVLLKMQNNNICVGQATNNLCALLEDRELTPKEIVLNNLHELIKQIETDENSDNYSFEIMVTDRTFCYKHVVTNWQYTVNFREITDSKEDRTGVAN